MPRVVKEQSTLRRSISGRLGWELFEILWLSKALLGKQIYARQVVDGTGSALLALAEALYRSTVGHGQTLGLKAISWALKVIFFKIPSMHQI